MSSAPELRPLRIGETVDVAIKLYLRNAATLLKIVALVVVPVSIIQMLFQMSTLPDGTEVVNGVLVGPEEPAWDVVRDALPPILLDLVATALATGAAMKAVAEAYLGAHPEARGSLSFATSKLRSIVWLSFLSLLFTALGFVLLIIPGFYLAIAFTVAVPVLMMEDVRGRQALSRSRELVKGRWWKVLWTVVLGFVIVGVISGAIGFGFGILLFTSVDSVTAYVAILGLADIITSVLGAPLQVAVATVIYFDLRVRKEGFDLQLLAERIGSAPGEQVAAGYTTTTSTGEPEDPPRLDA